MGLLVLALFVVLAQGQFATPAFSLTLFGKCTANLPDYACTFSARSQVQVTSVQSSGIVTQTTEYSQLMQSEEAAVQLQGTNPTSSTFSEAGMLKAGPNAFSFNGTGVYFRTAAGLHGSGHYIVTGTDGAFAGKTGVMTALNEGNETSATSVRMHLVVSFGD